jgi:hypothetical protein
LALFLGGEYEKREERKKGKCDRKEKKEER